jgi:hypothetical protein
MPCLLSVQNNDAVRLFSTVGFQFLIPPCLALFYGSKTIYLTVGAYRDDVP